jgi:hypothetical protein
MTEDCISNFEVALVFEPFEQSLKEYVDFRHRKLKDLSKKKGADPGSAARDYFGWALESCRVIANIALLLSLHTKKTMALNLEWFFVDHDEKLKFLIPCFHSLIRPLTPLEMDAVLNNLSNEAKWCYEAEFKDSHSQPSGAHSRKILNYSAGVIMFYILFGVPPFGSVPKTKKEKAKEESKWESKMSNVDKLHHYDPISIDFSVKNSLIFTQLEGNQGQISKIVEFILLLGEVKKVQDSDDNLAPFDPLLELLSYLETSLKMEPTANDLEYFLSAIEEHPSLSDTNHIMQAKAYLPSNLIVICDNSKKFKLYQILFDNMVIMDFHRPYNASQLSFLGRKNTMALNSDTSKTSVGFICKFYYSEVAWLEAHFSVDLKPLSITLLVDEKKPSIKTKNFHHFLSDSYRIIPIDNILESWTKFLTDIEKKEAKDSRFISMIKTSEVFDEYNQQMALSIADFNNEKSILR